MISKLSLVERYQKKMDLVPIVNGYPSKETEGLCTYCYGTFVKQGIDGRCKVLLEFDKGRPAQGIYFGCQLDEDTESQQVIETWEPIVDVIKRDFTLYWHSASTSDNRILEWDFKDNDYHRYWPFWIRLEDNEDIFEATKCIEVIISSLKAQGFKQTTYGTDF